MLKEWTLWRLSTPEGNTDARRRTSRFEHRMLPIPLTGPRHDKKIAAREREMAGRSPHAGTVPRAHAQGAWTAERDKRDHAPVALAANAITVPGN